MSLRHEVPFRTGVLPVDNLGLEIDSRRPDATFFSQYDSRYVGCHWLRFAPFLCTNFIGQGPESLTMSAAIKKCGDC